jgi:glycosyltransferase involved in cell wall biosynthesis
MKSKLKCIYREIEKYIKFNLEGNLNHSPSEFYKRENPEISIVISTFNGEIYLKPAVRSIQNQNFLNIEIIIVNDGSMDNTAKIVKDLMKEDRRIKFLSNGINRGTLFTKTRGVLNAKGQYVMTLDHDDLYSTKYVFSRLYEEAKKYNLDLLGFSTISTGIHIKDLNKNDYLNYIGTQVIKKPYIKKRFLGFDNRIESRTFLCLYYIKTELLIKTIKQLGNEFINRNIDAHDDTILMFILSRNVQTLKHLKEIFLILLKWPEKYSESLKFQRSVKKKERERKNCYSFLTFSEILLKFTENNEKFIAEKCFLFWFIREERCKNNTDINKEAIRICNLYLSNKYIDLNTKKEISLYLNQTKLQNKF